MSTMFWNKLIYLGCCKWNRKIEFECGEQKDGFFSIFMLFFIFAVVNEKTGGVGNRNSSFGENASFED